MIWPLVIQRIVKRDIARAIRWYDRQRACRPSKVLAQESIENNSLKIARSRPFFVASTAV